MDSIRVCLVCPVSPGAAFCPQPQTASGRPVLRAVTREGMTMFEGTDRNRNIMITVAVVAIAVIFFLYTTNRLPGM